MSHSCFPSFPPFFPFLSCFISYLFPSFFQFPYHHRCNKCLLFKSIFWASLVAQLPAMQETRAQSLSQEDLLEEGIATHSSVLAWRISQTEEPGRLLRSMRSQRMAHNWATNKMRQQMLAFQEHFKFWRLSGNTANYIIPINTAEFLKQWFCSIFIIYKSVSFTHRINCGSKKCFFFFIPDWLNKIIS